MELLLLREVGVMYGYLGQETGGTLTYHQHHWYGPVLIRTDKCRSHVKAHKTNDEVDVYQG